MNKTAFEMSTDTRIIIDYLRNTKEGATITYGQLSSHIERDVRKSARSSLNSAIRILINENIVFETVRNTGVRRMTYIEIANGAGRKSIDRIHRESRRGLKKLRCAAYGDLTNDALIRMNSDASILGVLNECTSAKSIKRLESTVTERGGSEMAIGTTLDAFKK